MYRGCTCMYVLAGRVRRCGAHATVATLVLSTVRCSRVRARTRRCPCLPVMYCCTPAGHTLYHLDDLTAQGPQGRGPFQAGMKDMPDIFTPFKEKVRYIARFL